ncbi:unnamed protein product [Pleuronectes platessa]|uniref:Ubiquitin-like protease family profile domain-containing protein n=1 Tax=Pleuronectes platessa TaxID=8262 RepID=A0A9N7UQZ6_PLEPL|nr:uncharacterized protein LOC128425767 [Pleuronectes platessa]CAB1435429.1 unnamed protein product [Pleuronectes platessa]
MDDRIHNVRLTVISSPVTLISSCLNLSSSPLISSPVTLMSSRLNLISSRLTVTPISSSVSLQTLWKKVDPLDYDVMVGAVREHHHWTLTVMYPKKRQSVYVDPFGANEDVLKKCSAVTRAFMKQRGHNCSRWSSETVPHARQVYTTSCSVIVCKLADMILNGEDMEDIFDKSFILRMRLQIGQRLIKEKDDLSDLCRVCGSYVTDVQWIACTLCDGWFHCSFVGQPPVDAPFYCPLCI